MKKVVWTFGLIAGGVLSAMMLLTLPFHDQIGFDKGLIIGYTTMVLAFLMVFFGVRSYRDNVAGGSVTFGRALTVGLLITVVASCCYVATWELVYYGLAPDFSEKLAANAFEHSIENAKKSGASEADIAVQLKKIEDSKEMYKKPLVNIAFTFIEPLPVGLLITFVTAGVLSRRRRTAS